jgi:hypothetical protein
MVFHGWLLATAVARHYRRCVFCSHQFGVFAIIMANEVGGWMLECWAQCWYCAVTVSEKLWVEIKMIIFSLDCKIPHLSRVFNWEALMHRYYDRLSNRIFQTKLRFTATFHTVIKSLAMIRNTAMSECASQRFPGQPGILANYTWGGGE